MRVAEWILQEQKSYCLLWLTALIRLPENFYLKTMYAISLK